MPGANHTRVPRFKGSIRPTDSPDSQTPRTDTETIDAENNWWGAADGPSGDGPGSGDSVDGASIDFDPFLAAQAPGTPCPAGAALDHFKCYKVVSKGTSNLDPRPIVNLEDQFGEEFDVRVDHAEVFCNPVVKNEEGEFEDLGDQHLTCYNIKGGKEEHQVQIDNQFGEQELRVLEARLLCVPTEKLGFEAIERPSPPPRP